MLPNEIADFIWIEIFQFPSQDGRAESLVWRAKCPTDADVNQAGCDIEAEKREKNDSIRYRGFISALAGEIRARTVRGHGFEVVHLPEPNRFWHSHVKVRAVGKPTKNDKIDFRVEMQKIFSGFIEQSCPPK
jgi:hypothetical protein